MTSRTVTVRCHELAPVIADLAANLATIQDSIAAAQAAGVGLLVLPELATSGYLLTAEEARTAGLRRSDLAELAAAIGTDLVVVLGYAESAGEGLYNSAAVLDRTGVRASYRKLHLWDSELLLFHPGDQEPPVVDTAAGRLGVLVCYDLEFPELPRQLALRGAEVIACPTNWPLVDRPEGEHPPERIQAMAAARSSRVAIAACDRRGHERGVDWTEGTSIIGADGWLHGEKSADGVLQAELRIEPDRHQLSERNHVFGDRRPDHYH